MRDDLKSAFRSLRAFKTFTTVALIGRSIPLEGGSYEVIGVMPPDFAYPVAAVRPTDLWVPYVVPAPERTRVPNTFSGCLQSIARLRQGTSLEQAQAQMNQIAAALEKTHPVWNKDNAISVLPLRDHVVGARTKSWMLMLLGAVTIVLLIACANVANLLLARASARERTRARSKFRVVATDSRAFGAAIASPIVAALIASAIPARRAASVDPMVALRSE